MAGKENFLGNLNADSPSESDVNEVWSEHYRENHDFLQTWQEKFEFIKAETLLRRKLESWKNKNGLNKRALDFLLDRVVVVLNKSQIRKIGKFASMEEKAFDRMLEKTMANPHERLKTGLLKCDSTWLAENRETKHQETLLDHYLRECGGSKDQLGAFLRLIETGQGGEVLYEIINDQALARGVIADWLKRFPDFTDLMDKYLGGEFKGSIKKGLQIDQVK